MNRTDYIIKRNLSKLSTSKLYNLLQMNECYDNKVVCLGFLFNEDMYYNFVESHLGAKKIIIIDNYIEQFEWIVSRFPFAKDKIQFVEYNDKIKFNKMPHFDVTIMNPPYNKNTHLKILDTIRNYSSKIINISPVRWLTDPFASLKKSTLRSYETLAKHINSINIIESRDASALFGIQIYSDVAIYEISEDENPNFDYFNFWKITKTPIQVSLIDKIINNKKTKLRDVIEHSINDGIRVPVTDIAGNRGCLPTYKDICYCVDGYVDGKLWHACKNNGGYEKEGEMIPNSIKFENIPDAVNFYNSYQNLLELKGICRLTVQQQHIQTFVLPFLDDYSHPITKEDIKKYYNFTDDEINELGRIGQLKNNEKI